MSINIQHLLDDLTHFADLTNEELFALDPADVHRIQLTGLQHRFQELRPRIRVVDRLTEDLGIEEIRNPDDIVPLCLPHTIYKSYAISFIEKGQYDRLTHWLDSLTAHDLSEVDTSGCDSLESWLDQLEAQSPLRPRLSSGTTGKLSFMPRSTVGEPFFLNGFLRALDGFRNEPASGLRDAPPFFMPWPTATGRQAIPKMFGILRETIYKGEEDRIHTLGGHWNADMLWLAGKLRKAEAQGTLDRIELTPALKKIQEQIIGQQQAHSERVKNFIEEAIIRHRGQRVFFYAPIPHLMMLAEECKKQGLRAEFSPDSFVMSGGSKIRAKGVPLPANWHDLVYDVFPYPYQDVYGMSEITATARKCAAGFYHMPPWIILYVLDPVTGKAYARIGEQTGRLAIFDLLAQTHWGGYITADKVTVNWDGHCSCGRLGPYIHDNIERYTDLKDDDKITCAMTPDAYDRAVDYLLDSLDN